MHVYDPNGSIHAYRKQRKRRDSYRLILCTIGLVCVIVLIVCGVQIISSIYGK